MSDHNRRPLGAHRDDRSLLERLFLSKGIQPVPELLQAVADIRSRQDGVLDLSGRALYPALVWVCLAEVLASSVAGLRGLLLGDCALPKDAVAALVGRTMARSPTLKSLDLRGNNLQAEACRLLARALRHSACLEKLNLSWNALGLDLESFSEFSTSVAANWTLRELDLSNNSLPPRAGRLIGQGLEKNSTLDSLDLRWNMLGMEGGRAILSGLEFNNSIQKISLQGNCIPDVITDALEVFLQRNREKRTTSQTIHDVAHQPETCENLERKHKDEIDRLNDVASELEHHLAMLRASQEAQTAQAGPTPIPQTSQPSTTNPQILLIPQSCPQMVPLLPPAPPVPLLSSQQPLQPPDLPAENVQVRTDLPSRVPLHSVGSQASCKMNHAGCQVEDYSTAETIENARRELSEMALERDRAQQMAAATQNQLAAAEVELNALRDSLNAVNGLVREAAQARQEAEAEARATLARAVADARAAAALDAEARLASTRADLETLRTTHSECPRRIQEIHIEYDRQLQSLQKQLSSSEARLAEATTRASASDHELHSLQTRLADALADAQRARLAETDRAARLYAAFAGYWSSLGAPPPPPPVATTPVPGNGAQFSSLLHHSFPTLVDVQQQQKTEKASKHQL